MQDPDLGVVIDPLNNLLVVVSQWASLSTRSCLNSLLTRAWECRSVDPSTGLFYTSAHLWTLSDNTSHPNALHPILHSYHLGLDAVQIMGHSLGMIHHVNGVVILEIWNWADGRRKVVSFPALLIVRCCVTH